MLITAARYAMLALFRMPCCEHVLRRFFAHDMPRGALRSACVIRCVADARVLRDAADYDADEFHMPRRYAA